MNLEGEQVNLVDGADDHEGLERAARPVGVWSPVRGGERYARSLRMVSEWVRWADCPGFSCVGDRRRVLLLGESVARGMHYDPVFTPAGVLQEILGKALRGGVEVLDLARTGASMQHLLVVAEVAADLRPDVVVVFAGNNWKYELGQPPHHMRRDEVVALEEQGALGLLKRRTGRLAEVVDSFVRDVCEVLKRNARVVFVLPESNLVDWFPHHLAPVLDNGLELQWQRLSERLQSAVFSADWTAVEQLAVDIHRIDGGLSDRAYRALGEVALERGGAAQALEHFRKARDIRLWHDISDAPSLPSAGADAARAAARRCGASVVDLPTVLPRLAPAGVPDRSLFLDACHLNRAGIAAAMAEVARHVGELLEADMPSAEQCLEAVSKPGDLVTAGAHLCAAIHNAHWGQPREIVAFHCETAVRASRAIVSVMREFCVLQASPAPWWMRTPRALLGVPNVSRFITWGLAGRKLFDEMLIDAMMEIVNRESRSRPSPRDDSALVSGRRMNLVSAQFVPGWRPPDWAGVLGNSATGLMGTTGPRHYFRAHGPRSRFMFVARAPSAVMLELTCRLGTPGAGTARVLVNECEVDAFELSECWRTRTTAIDASVVLTGCNHVEIVWDRTSLITPSTMEIAMKILTGSNQDLSVILGEVHSIYATAE